MHRVGQRQNPSSRLLPSEPVHLCVTYHDWNFESKADIHRDEVVKTAQPQYSSRRGTCYAFSSRFPRVDMTLPILEWSHSYPKFHLVLIMTITSHVEVRIRIPRSSCICLTWVAMNFLSWWTGQCDHTLPTVTYLTY